MPLDSDRWWRARAYGVALIGFLAFVWILVVYVPGLLIAFDFPSGPPADQPTLANEYRRTILQLIGGLVVAVGLYLTYRRIQASETANRIAEEAHRETQRLTETGQVTERFTRAIEQLGSDDLSIRLGGIYSLERIARDSEDDHWTVMEVLSAFLRENATEEANAPLGNPLIDLPPYFTTQTDLQAALTVIGRRIERNEVDRLDLREVWLRGYTLRAFNLQRVRLDRAQLEEASLREARLEEASFFMAHLQRANLREAHLERAVLNRAHLGGAYLFGAHLKKAELNAAHLEGAHLGEARLEQTDLSGALLDRSTLMGAGLEEADLNEAILEGAHLQMARFNSDGYRLTSGTPRWIEGAIFDGIRYEPGMPDPREQWPPPENWRELATLKEAAQQKANRKKASPKKSTPPASGPPPADRGGDSGNEPGAA